MLGRGARLGLAVAAVVGCSGEAPLAVPARPSILLLVVDTLRADAVSSYGAPQQTTPEIDRRAREGLLFERAYAPSPWTLPSHATLLSGLDVAQHRAGIGGRGGLTEDVVTLAELLADAGYHTAAFSENATVSDAFQLLQGFQHRVASGGREVGGSHEYVEIDAVRKLARHLQQDRPEPPFFVFVNLLDPHTPYEIRDENPFLPPQADPVEVRNRSGRPERLLCGGLPDPKQIEIQRGLYWGDVRAADRKVGRVLQLLTEALGDAPLITVLTSDHGEYFGEDGLMGHEFGLHEAVLHVPLVVHGLPGAAPARISRPVGLVDVPTSIVKWAGIETATGFAGRALPEAPEPAPAPRSLFAAYSDVKYWVPEVWQENSTPTDLDRSRQFCSQTDPVWGGMATLLRFPFKLRWFERYPAQLFDLSWDPEERSDLAPQREALVAELRAELEPLVRSTFQPPDPATDQPISKQGLEALKALGYIEDDG